MKGDFVSYVSFNERRLPARGTQEVASRDGKQLEGQFTGDNHIKMASFRVSCKLSNLNALSPTAVIGGLPGCVVPGPETIGMKKVS